MTSLFGFMLVLALAMLASSRARPSVQLQHEKVMLSLKMRLHCSAASCCVSTTLFSYR
jgi:hypothetical protein